jgi:hypothetical protein
MTRRFTRRTAVTVTCIATSSFAVSAHAQITEVGRTPVADIAQLTFGYRCDDRFVIRNDGAAAIALAYAVEKGNEHTPITLGARELVELESKSKAPLELWMDGKLIAKAEKEKRSCKDVSGSASVLVAPLEVTSTTDNRSTYRGNAYPFFDPWMYGFYGYYGGLGFRPFYRGFVGVPIVIGRGGVRRGR